MIIEFSDFYRVAKFNFCIQKMESFQKKSMKVVQQLEQDNFQLEKIQILLQSNLLELLRTSLKKVKINKIQRKRESLFLFGEMAEWSNAFDLKSNEL